MIDTEKIGKLEKQFSDYSDKVFGVVSFIRNGLTRNMQVGDLIDMKKGLVNDLNEIMFADQKYMHLLGQVNSHPNYEKFMTYVKAAKAALDKEIAERDMGLEGELGYND